MRRLRLAALALALLAVVAGIVSMVAQGRGGGSAAAPVAEVGERERIRVEVLNASGVPGLARGATARLRDAGYDVVFFGNGRGFAPDSSLVLDRVGRPQLADQIARRLEIARVASRPDTTLYLDVTVVLGKDYATPRPPRAVVE